MDVEYTEAVTLEETSTVLEQYSSGYASFDGDAASPVFQRIHLIQGQKTPDGRQGLITLSPTGYIECRNAVETSLSPGREAVRVFVAPTKMRGGQSMLEQTMAYIAVAPNPITTSGWKEDVADIIANAVH
ncbi:hypothetical protein EBH_0066730 [Eimeria brunetti]|uniref:Uncharacterized protein n=1 Tax=Eimeria brunetti TaxID=51314 RepID=U6L7Y8_9EIME|nr:hypothetical protein EBH_0066730 [Eimeria brunetti]